MKCTSIQIFGVNWRTVKGLPSSTIEPPVDMLRYDSCFTSREFPHVVVYPTWAGYGKPRPTMERWHSFVRMLTPINSRTIPSVSAIEQHLRDHPDQWYTIRTYGTTATMLTLADFQTVKKREDLKALERPWTPSTPNV